MDALLQCDTDIDLVVPRGGERLIRTVVERSRLPVLKHDQDNRHVYVADAADLHMAAELVFSGKVQRSGMCNAAVAERFLTEVDSVSVL